MKFSLTYPKDAPFAVDVPDLEADEVQPGETIEVPEGCPIDAVVSFVEQGWEPDSAAKKAVDAELKKRDADAGYATGGIVEPGSQHLIGEQGPEVATSPDDDDKVDQEGDH